MKEKTFNTITDKQQHTLQRIHTKAKECKWRENFHIEPLCGSLGAPIGIEKVGDEYHLYYLWKPMAQQSEGSIWYKVKTQDFIHYTNVGIALEGDLLWDNYGCEGGCIYEENGNTYYLYVGKHQDYQKEEKNYILIAKRDQEGCIRKGKKPLFEENIYHLSSGVSLLKLGETYYLFVGDDLGKILVYESHALFEGWQRLGELVVSNVERFGSQIDALSLVEIDHQVLMAVSYRDGEEANCKLYEGVFDPRKLEFICGEGKEIDQGYDYYHATFSKTNGNIYLLGTLNHPNHRMEETQEEGYEGELALVRRCDMKDGKLRMFYACNPNALKQELVFTIDDSGIHKDTLHGRMPETCLIQLHNKAKESCEFNLFALQKKNGLTIKYNKYAKELVVSASDLETCKEYQERVIPLIDELTYLDIFVDHSSVEIYVNYAKVALSMRLFPKESEHMLRMIARGMDLDIYTCAKTSSDDFAL